MISRMARGRAEPTDKEPTFQEFVNYLLNTEVYSDDEHWQPIALRCRFVQPIATRCRLVQPIALRCRFSIQ
jgi:hypothetical protein